MFVVYSSVVIFLTQFSYGAEILAVIPTPSYSHQIAYTELWKQLSLRGHKVTLITTNPVIDPKLTNLTEIDMNWIYKLVANIGTKIAEDEMSMWNMHYSIKDITLNIIEGHLSYAPIQDLIRSKKKFDLVFVEFIYPEFLAFAEASKCPTIMISSVDAFLLSHQAMGNPTHPVLYPEIGSPFVAPLNFKDRVISTLFSLHTWYYFSYKLYPERDELITKYFNSSVTINELTINTDMLFLNVNPIVQDIRALGPATINIGDPRRTVSSKPLSKDLAQFLDSAEEGFVYFSLGSNVKSKDLHQDSLTAIIEALSEIPYKVIWKFEADSLPEKPQNVKLVKWAPQQNILSHPNIRLFVTQGGLQSMEETVYNKVPCVVIPFFADQERNANIMESKGFAKVVGRKPSIRKTELKSAILEVINNLKYRNSVRRLKQLSLDTPMTGLEKAIWWTEYVIRNKGAKHLRNPAADLPFYQYFLLDVIGFLILTTIILFSVSIVVVRIVFKSLFEFINRLFLRKKKTQ